MKKPTVKTNCAANFYATPNERIIEYGNYKAGGLISFTERDGKLYVSLYRHDPAVVIQICEEERASEPG